MNLSQATKYVLCTLFMLDKLRYGKLIEPKTTWANQEHASCLLQGIISWTNGIKRKLKKHAKQGTVRMFKWTFKRYNEERYSKTQNIHKV